MSNNPVSFFLPQKDEMLQRLLAVDSSNHLQQSFYPILLKEAGQSKVAAGVVLLLQLAIYDYSENLPPIMGVLMEMKMNDFIDALVRDEDFAKETKAFFLESQK